MKEFMKGKKGITLIAMILTIIVLIILAGVLINISLGNNGLFTKAKTAKEMYANAQDYEETEIAKMTNNIDNYVGYSRTGGNNINYSLQEQDTGLKWIDGEKIYQKTVNCGALPNNTYKNIAHGITNIGTIINVFGIATATNENKPIPYTSMGSAHIALEADNTNIRIDTNTDRTYFTGYVTIQYTKTTPAN